MYGDLSYWLISITITHTYKKYRFNCEICGSHVVTGSLFNVIFKSSSYSVYCRCGLEDLRLFLAVARDFLLLINVQTGSGAHAAFCSVATVVLFLSIKWLVLAVCHSHPYYARLRLSGAVPLLPLYAVMVWTGTTLLSPNSGCKFRFVGRAPTKQLNAASCMESLSKMNVGWDLASVLKVVGCVS